MTCCFIKSRLSATVKGSRKTGNLPASSSSTYVFNCTVNYDNIASYVAIIVFSVGGSKRYFYAAAIKCNVCVCVCVCVCVWMGGWVGGFECMREHVSEKMVNCSY